MAKGFLTYECISFCQNYLSTENQDVGLPMRKHLGRLNGYGHREGPAHSLSESMVEKMISTGLTGSRYNTYS